MPPKKPASKSTQHAHITVDRCSILNKWQNRCKGILTDTHQGNKHKEVL